MWKLFWQNGFWLCNTQLNMTDKIKINDTKETYTEFHVKQNPIHVYPSEWVIRTFLGTYPELSLDKSTYQHSKILDIGYGDGRNFPLFKNMGMDIYGIEITDTINDLCLTRMKAVNIHPTLKVGSNSNIPFESGYFDYILASSSCYYVDRGTSFEDNLKEYSRVLKPGGILVVSVGEKDSFIFKNAIDIGDGHFEIVNDTYGLRNGYIMRRFDSAEEIKTVFGKYFNSFSIGSGRDNFYGHKISLYYIICKKKDDE